MEGMLTISFLLHIQYSKNPTAPCQNDEKFFQIYLLRGAGQNAVTESHVPYQTFPDPMIRPNLETLSEKGPNMQIMPQTAGARICTVYSTALTPTLAPGHFSS